VYSVYVFTIIKYYTIPNLYIDINWHIDDTLSDQDHDHASWVMLMVSLTLIHKSIVNVANGNAGLTNNSA
jgi:hypothetical protein